MSLIEYEEYRFHEFHGGQGRNLSYSASWNGVSVRASSAWGWMNVSIYGPGGPGYFDYAMPHNVIQCPTPDDVASIEGCRKFIAGALARVHERFVVEDDDGEDILVDNSEGFALARKAMEAINGFTEAAKTEA